MNSFASIDIFFETQLCVGIRVAVVDDAERDAGRILPYEMIVASPYDIAGDAVRPQADEENVAVPEAAMIHVWTTSAAGKCIQRILASR
jgi:hypothetical protein